MSGAAPRFIFEAFEFGGGLTAELAQSEEVIVVGAGLAGLACARALAEGGLRVRLLERAEAVGGRVRSDRFEGFLLDRGFQVFLTAYPECRRQLDLSALHLAPFDPGALVRANRRFHRVSDPWRRPADALATLAAPVGSLGDKLNIARLRADVTRTALDALWHRPNRSTLDRLKGFGFSATMLDRFFRPFFGGILLDRELMGSSRMFDFVFRMLAEGDTALPAGGMQALPDQLEMRLRRLGVVIQLGCEVVAASDQAVRLADGSQLVAGAVVIAADGPGAAALVADLAVPASRGVTCLYYASERDPVGEPCLLLDGDGAGPVNNLAVLSTVAATYAPPGAHLISATVLGAAPVEASGVEAADAALDQAVRGQLRGWFGPSVGRWRRLRVYRIPHAQPGQDPPALEPAERPLKVGGLFVAGDHRTNASLHGALLSGRRVAEAVLAEQRHERAA